MKQIISCVPVVFFGLLLSSSSQAKQTFNQHISTQQKTPGLTIHRVSPAYGQLKKTDCNTQQRYQVRPPLHAARSAQQKRLGETAIWQDLRSHHIGNPSPSTITLHKSISLAENTHQPLRPQGKAQPPQIVEAQGWVRDKKGHIRLTSQPQIIDDQLAKC